MLKVVRNILAVIIGYAIFVISAIALFKLTRHAPHAPASIKFQVFTFFYGLIFSFLAGVFLQLISGSGNIKLNYVLAGIMAGFALFSLITASGSHWTQTLAIFIFAPASLLGGFFQLSRSTRKKLPAQQI